MDALSCHNRTCSRAWPFEPQNDRDAPSGSVCSCSVSVTLIKSEAKIDGQTVGRALLGAD